MNKLLFKILKSMKSRETVLIGCRIEAAVECGVAKCPYGRIWRRFSRQCPFYWREGPCVRCSEGKRWNDRIAEGRGLNKLERDREKASQARSASSGSAFCRTNQAAPPHCSIDTQRLQKYRVPLAGSSSKTGGRVGPAWSALVFSKALQEMQHPQNSGKLNKPVAVLRVLLSAFFVTLPGLLPCIFPIPDHAGLKASEGLYLLLWSCLIFSFVFDKRSLTRIRMLLNTKTGGTV